MLIKCGLINSGVSHLDDFGLINMNGRLYEPVLGRFLNADPTGYTASTDAFIV